MRFKISVHAFFAVALFLTGCGGDSNTPYDGTWAAVYPALSKESTITDTKTVFCSTPPATLTINNSVGSTTQACTCVTSVVTSGVPPTSTVVGTEITYATISVSIEPNPVSGGKDVLKAVVNGVQLTGTCISTSACSAASIAGDTLGLTR
jgi:hypothetical protein